MSDLQIFLILSGIVITTMLAGFACFPAKARIRAFIGESGEQEVFVTVQGGYSPDLVVVQRGIPVLFTFVREGREVGSEHVIFPYFNKQIFLPEGQEVNLELTPEKSGQYAFQSKMGSLRGTLIVE